MEKLQTNFDTFLFDKNNMNLILSENTNRDKNILSFNKENSKSYNEDISFIFFENRDNSIYPLIDNSQIETKRYFIGVVIYSTKTFYMVKDSLLINSLPAKLKFDAYKNFDDTIDSLKKDYKSLVLDNCTRYIKSTQEYSEMRESDFTVNKNDVISTILKESLAYDDNDREHINDMLLPITRVFNSELTSKSLFVDFLTCPEKATDNWCKSFVENNKDLVVKWLVSYERTLEMKNDLLNDEEFQKTLNFFIKKQQKNAKTVKITYQKDNQQMTFMLPANVLSIQKRSIFYDFIKTINQRQEYIDTFGKNNIEWQYIQKISYGKDTLYEK